MRYILGVLLLLAFIGFQVLMFLSANGLTRSALLPVPAGILFGLAIIAFLVALISDLLLIAGIGGAGKRSLWRTPLMLAIIMLWSFGFGAFLVYNLSGSSEKRDELARLMDRNGISKSSALYNDINAAVDRDERALTGGYMLLGFGALTLLGLPVAFLIARKQRARANASTAFVPLVNYGVPPS